MKNKEDSFSIIKRIQSFGYAFAGLAKALKSEHNLRVHIVAAIGVTALGFWVNLSSIEWSVIVLCIAAVISAELFNSAIERLADFVQPNFDPKIGWIKDVAAAAVLVVSIASFIIGIIIFLPKVL